MTGMTSVASRSSSERFKNLMSRIPSTSEGTQINSLHPSASRRCGCRLWAAKLDVIREANGLGRDDERFQTLMPPQP